MVYYSSKLWGKTEVWNMEAFIAPENFNPESQPLNIVTVFGNYNNVNKGYIFSFTSAIATLTLSASSGITYRWGETIDGNDYVYDIASGTAFTAGSTKRYVIVNSTSSSLSATVPIGGIWLYVRKKIYSISSTYNNYLKYIHCQNLHSLTTIGTNAFSNCTGFTGTLTIPNSVTTIAENVFINCEFNHIENYSNEFLVEDEVLYTASTITALYSPKGYSGTLTLKTNTTRIVNNCFLNNNLRVGTLTIPNSVTTIETNAFYNCTGFTGTLTIPNSVTTIETNAFRSCTGFTGTLTIPNSVTTIGNYAFRYCTGFTGIGTINGSPSIGILAFDTVSSISEWHILSLVAPSVQINTWGNYAKPLHVKIGATGYNIEPFTNTAIFSSIIYDL